MGRPKIKTIETAIDLEKVELPETKEIPQLDNSSEAELKKDLKKAKGSKAAGKKVASKKSTRSNRYSKLAETIEKNKEYALSEAIELVKKTATVKFDSGVEAHINLNIDPAKTDQQIRTTTQLPHGSGKKVTILVFGAKDNKAIKDSGALVGTEETLSEIEKGKLDFQKVVATAEWMPKLAKVAKILGPKGLMPNPKSGTVTADPEKTVANLSSGGTVEIKTENSPIIHVAVGKASFKTSDLEENVKTLVAGIRNVKPETVKKELVKNVYLTSSMGPSVKLDLSSLKN